MRAISIAAGVGLLCVTLAFTAERRPAPEPPPPGPDEVDDVPDVCSTGCSASPTATGELGADEYLALLRAWGAEPLGADSQALDALLFHGRDVVELEVEHGTPGLGDEHRAHLLGEVSREGVWLAVRAVNDDGVERLRLAPTLVPLGEKQHLFPEHALDVTPPEISGTVHRVGVGHLWTRL